MDESEMRELVGEIRAMREQLIRMDERMSAVQDHESRLRALESFGLVDHDARLGALERWKYALPASFITAVVSGIVAIISYVR